MYHLQNIQWLEKYGTVFGLGHIHSRLAFGSSWFLIETFFAFSYILGTPLHAIHHFVIFLLYTFALKWSIKTPYTQSEFNIFKKVFVFILILSTISYRRMLYYQNTGTDFPANMLFLLIVMLWINFMYHKKQKMTYMAIILFMSAITVTYKTSMATLVIFTLYVGVYILLSKHTPEYKLKNISLIVILGLLVSIPFLIRNIIQSGYLIYPLYQIDLFNFDWKLPIEMAISDNDSIKSWARKPSDYSFAAAHYNLFEWVPIWWNNNSFVHFQKFFIFMILSFLLAIIFEIVKFTKSKCKKTREYITFYPIYTLLLISLLFWFLMAPDPRFAFSILHCTFAFSTSVILSSYEIRNQLKYLLEKHRLIITKIYVTLLFIIFISLLTLSILGDKNRIGYFDYFELVKSDKENQIPDDVYRYTSKIKFNSKIFRHSDIYAITSLDIDENKHDITNIIWKEHFATIIFDSKNKIGDNFKIIAQYKSKLKNYKILPFLKPLVILAFAITYFLITPSIRLYLFTFVTKFLKKNPTAVSEKNTKYVITIFILLFLIYCINSNLPIVLPQPYSSNSYEVYYHKNIGKYFLDK